MSTKLKTLVTDPFEDDAISILEWAYGPEAKQTFIDMRGGGTQRVGQAFMNTLWIYDSSEYKRVGNSPSCDPFYQDSHIPAALDRLTSK